MDSFYFVIGMTLVGFLALAAALLVPVYYFLKKEEKVAALWTEEHLDRPGSDDESTMESGSRANLPSTGDGKSPDRLPVG